LVTLFGVDAASGADGFLPYLVDGDLGLDPPGHIGGGGGGDSGAAGTKLDSLAILWGGDCGIGVEPLGVAAFVTGTDSGIGGDVSFPSATFWAGDLGISHSTSLAAALAGDAAAGQELPFPLTAVVNTEIFTDDVGQPAEAALLELLGVDTGVPLDTISGPDATYRVTTLVGLDRATAGDRQFRSHTIYVVDAATWTEVPASYADGLILIINVGVGYHVYDNDGAGPIDYTTPVATVYGLENVTWVSGGLTYPSDWKFGVRAFNACGEEQNLDCFVEIILDASGNDITNRPAPPSGLRGFASQ
jgi:hypothetical protein